MTNKSDIVGLGQASYLCEGIEKNLAEIGIEKFDYGKAWDKASKLTIGQYKRCLALLFNSEYAELKEFLKQLQII